MLLLVGHFEGGGSCCLQGVTASGDTIARYTWLQDMARRIAVVMGVEVSCAVDDGGQCTTNVRSQEDGDLFAEHQEYTR